ncbi:hypothetical protein FJT64_015701 [Amphibalanus amphitrite]|uniref:Uncharacterized protein n=1 Tax=Amphibalanus amphitrite TaxID=1232801 RepID=A0A6A4XBU3_AMPAM|nr:hypothetical protein FJT64_015701 [Amphibalanus amphitrite]
MRETGPGSGRVVCTFCMAEKRLQRQRQGSGPARTAELAVRGTAAAPPAPYRPALEPAAVSASAGQAAVGAGTSVPTPLEAAYSLCPVTSAAVFFPGMAPFVQYELGR